MCVLTFEKKNVFALSTDISSPKWPSVSVAPSPARPEVNLGCFCPLQVGKWRRPVLFSTLGHRWSSSSVHRRAQESTLVKKSVRRVKCASQGCYCQLHVRNRGGAKLSPFPSTTLLCTQLARVGMWCLLLRVQSTVVQEKNEKILLSYFLLGWEKGWESHLRIFLKTITWRVLFWMITFRTLQEFCLVKNWGRVWNEVEWVWKWMSRLIYLHSILFNLATK